MSYKCSTCGNVHDELPRFFLFRAPDQYTGAGSGLVFDNKFTCRHPDGACFISCEIELPILGSDDLVMGFICWAEVPEATYLSYMAYRSTVDDAGAFEELIEGHLANGVPGISNACGVKVKFRVLPNDPTPYIRWAEPHTPLAARMKSGATAEYWHSVVEQW